MKQAHNASIPSFHQPSQKGSSPLSRQQASVLLSQNSNTKTQTSVTAGSGPDVWGDPGASWSLNQVNQRPCCSAPWSCWHHRVWGRSSPARERVQEGKAVSQSSLGPVLWWGRCFIKVAGSPGETSTFRSFLQSNTSTHAAWAPLHERREIWGRYINMNPSYVFHAPQPLYCCLGGLVLPDAFQYFLPCSAETKAFCH